MSERRFLSPGYSPLHALLQGPAIAGAAHTGGGRSDRVLAPAKVVRKQRPYEARRSLSMAGNPADSRESYRAESRERARSHGSVWTETILPVTSAVATLGLVVIALLFSYL